MPTCATSADAASSLTRRPQRGRGFTLVELLVVLALMGLAVALVPPAYDKLRDTMRYRDALRTLITELRVARQNARIEGREVRFVADLGERRFGIEGSPLHPLEPPLQMRVTVAGIEWSERQVGAIRFLSQGGATGGSIDLLRGDGSGTRVRVDWLSGAVSQEPIAR